MRKEDLSWKQYWERLEGNQKIFQVEADEYVANLENEIPLAASWRIFDFGCGFGFVAQTLSPKASQIYVWDQAKNMRDIYKHNLAGCSNVICIDVSNESELPEDVVFDLILVNSVVQYMDLHEFRKWLNRWASMLIPSGRIVISDIIPENLRSLRDMFSLISFSLQRGFLFQAMIQGLQELKCYWKIRKSHPLLRLSLGMLKQLSAQVGLDITLLKQNLTYRKQRFSAVLSRSNNSLRAVD